MDVYLDDFTITDSIENVEEGTVLITKGNRWEKLECIIVGTNDIVSKKHR